MEPKEAINKMRQEANELMQMIRGMRARKSSDFSQKDLINWLCISLQSHADFKLATADMMTSLKEKYSDLRFDTTTNEQVFSQSESEKQSVESPPFDEDFWLGLGDINT
jgi:hypothetical protein